MTTMNPYDYFGHAYKSMNLAKEIHKTKNISNTDCPYIYHISNSVAITSSVITQPLAISMAWLQDSGLDHEFIKEEISWQTANGVFCLSAITVENIKNIPSKNLEFGIDFVQTIKIANIISHLSIIKDFNIKYTEKFVDDQKIIVDHLTDSNPHLTDIAKKYIEELSK